MAEIAIDRLIFIGFENDSKVAFDNMALITRLEVLITYTNEKSLK